ncbi:type I restriction endonuclease [Caulobacter sp. UC70_42]|uniref:type I restriction endonuclease n=1 Tax=Caulobacter sp. UC70_42 TaxID=3374551 RepID=UPI003758181E
MFDVPLVDSLITESDVEQKFLYPLLLSSTPLGLGHDHASIQTKSDIRKFTIGKGSDQKLYFPDYIITQSGIPYAIIEAKRPGESLDEALREGRLYASEINHASPSGLNPVEWVLASDGLRTVLCRSDSASIHLDMQLADFVATNIKFSKLQEALSAEALSKWYARVISKIRPNRYWKPRKLVGGISLQREEVGLNSFGATISADFSHIFNPLSRADRAFIVKNAYISSKRRERYVEPIDRVIRASVPISESRSQAIEDTAKPNEIIKVFRRGRSLERQVMLIIGNAGAGKTTFVDYLQEVALPRDVRDATVWLRLDMNPAPVSRDEIYDWLRRRIVKACCDHYSDIDFDDLDTIKAVFAPAVTKFRKGAGRLFEGNQEVYNEKLGEIILGLQADSTTLTENIVRYCVGDRGKLLVVVFDNSDKKLLSEQLLMFEVAQWIQKEFSALVVLPLREETYDNHQGEPPLDTALKDLVFRIEPPLFQKILQSRIQLALNAIGTSGAKTFRYDLPNGMQVEYPASDQGHYLSSILRSVFEHDMHVRRLIVGLAGRNMRRAMEIFLEFCTSGHITEDHILKMVQSRGQYVLPLSLVTTVLLRSNLRYYDSDRAYLKNIYSAVELDDRPNHFARILILSWLSERATVFGPRRLEGYASISLLRAELSRFGVDEQVFRRELEALARGYCITSEDFRTSSLTDEDLVSIAPAGRVHLQIKDNQHYLAAIAEDTWFSQAAVAEAIADRIKNPREHYSNRVVLYNALDVLRELKSSLDTQTAAYQATFSDNRLQELLDLSAAERAVDRYERSVVSGAWVGIASKITQGSRHSGTVEAVKNFGAFISLHGVSGLLHSSKMPKHIKLEPGMEIEVSVLDIDPIERKLSLIW